MLNSSYSSTDRIAGDLAGPGLGTDGLCRVTMFWHRISISSAVSRLRAGFMPLNMRTRTLIVQCHLCTSVNVAMGWAEKKRTLQLLLSINTSAEPGHFSRGVQCPPWFAQLGDTGGRNGNWGNIIKGLIWPIFDCLSQSWPVLSLFLSSHWL